MTSETARGMVQRHLSKDWHPVSVSVRATAETLDWEQLVDWVVRSQTSKARLSERLAVIAELVARAHHGNRGARLSDVATLDMLIGLATAGEVLVRESVV